MTAIRVTQNLGITRIHLFLWSITGFLNNW